PATAAVTVIVVAGALALFLMARESWREDRPGGAAQFGLRSFCVVTDVPTSVAPNSRFAVSLAIIASQCPGLTPEEKDLVLAQRVQAELRVMGVGPEVAVEPRDSPVKDLVAHKARTWWWDVSVSGAGGEVTFVFDLSPADMPAELPTAHKKVRIICT
ncbi:hypothetical protein, partial [Gordonia alkanivorans]|uniref:hypothetical protein n=1 Tax=Gordonia alkanivorans TaxID=84096 RepID=UPI001E3CD685